MLSPPSKQVIADGEARQGEVAGFFADLDQREVGRAAADVGDEHEVADRRPACASRRRRVEPGVERGLRFFEQREVLEPGGAGGLHGQFAGRGVERRRHRQHDVLRFEPVAGDVLRDPAWFHASARCLRYARAGIERRNLAAGVGRAVRAESATVRSTPG